MTEDARDEWLFGWDKTPGIVSVWAEREGHVFIWRRLPETGELVREEARFRPWMLLTSLADLAHLGERLRPEKPREREIPPGHVTHRELRGSHALRHLVRASDGRELMRAVLTGASRRLGQEIRDLRQLGGDSALSLPPEEQYLAASGRTFFRGLTLDSLRRMQIDLETTGLDPVRHRIFLVALRTPAGITETHEITVDGDEGERSLLVRVIRRVVELDPDVIENHNLHGFDLPFLVHRAKVLGVPLTLARLGGTSLRERRTARGGVRYTMPGRELIDTLDAVRRHDFSARDLPGHGLKAVARHFGLSGLDGQPRELIPGARVHEVFLRDPARVRRYAEADVEEAAGLARLLGGAAFALAQMVPRRYERLADAGPATGVIDPLLVRAYLRRGAALPTRELGDGTTHQGAALHLFATGVAHRIVKADVASLYPSLMRAYSIGPQRDRLGALLFLVDRLVELRLAAKAKAKQATVGSSEQHTQEALSAAMKLVVNSAYGYLGAAGLTRFSDVHAANEVTRRGRGVLSLICRELAARGVTLLEGDTDGVYFSVPESFTEVDERRVVAEVAALLPPLVRLEYDGRYAAMLSHEPKNYVLQSYDGRVRLRGVAFRSSRAERYGVAFLEQAVVPLLAGDLVAVRQLYVDTALALRDRKVATLEVTARVRITKSKDEYFAAGRRELTYEAMLAAGRTEWKVGEKIRVYRAGGGRAALLAEDDEDARDEERTDGRDYDVDYYQRLLRETFAERLSRAMTPDDFAEVFADPAQGVLFSKSLSMARPILTPLDVDVSEPAGAP